MNPHRTVAAVCLVVALAACGGGDVASVDALADEQPGTTVTAVADQSPPATRPPGPVSTLSPDIPAEFEGGLSPVDVDGDRLPVAADLDDDPAVGSAAPTLVGYDADGEPIRVQPGEDGPMMLVFLAHWCPHCNAEVPRLNQLRDEGRFPDGLRIVAVLTGQRPDAPNWPPQDWIEDQMGWTHETLVDGVDMVRQNYVAYDAYGIAGFPFVVLVDADGTVATRWSGEREPDEIIAELEEHLGL